MTLQQLEERITAIEIKLKRLEKDKEELLDHLIYMKLISAALFDKPDMH